MMSVFRAMLCDVAGDRLSIEEACEGLDVADHAVRDELIDAATSLQLDGAEAWWRGGFSRMCCSNVESSTPTIH